MSAPTTIDRDEILEVEAEPVAPPEDSTSPKGVNVHHFQDSRPIVRWKTGQKPVFNEKK